jgi:protein tyrosine phosphatase (PTP) superfamily phosphohydrolase (DUF442 family)
MRRIIRQFVLLVAAGLGVAGCQTPQHQTSLVTPSQSSYCSADPGKYCPGQRLIPQPMPPAGYPPAPGVRPGPGVQLGTPCPPGVDVRPSQRQSFAPPLAGDDSRWGPPSEAGVRLLTPAPLNPDPAGAQVRASPPEPLRTAPKVEADNREPVPELPVGIAHFTDVKGDKIAAGFRPHPTDGIPWLQARGYRTILYLRAPDVADANDRKLIERYGLKYVSVTVSPELLTRELVDQLKDLIADSADRPLFVYDKDGAATAAMFYLYFRLYDNMPEEKARSRAMQLGLKDDASLEAQSWWNAIRKVLPN